MIGRISQFNFREIHHQVMLLIDDPDSVIAASTMFPCVQGDNALLLYGYIDHELGISFEVLCIAKYEYGQPCKFRSGSSDATFKIRYDSIKGTLMNVA